jgi:GNAT superfamily N-acetyltransferase
MSAVAAADGLRLRSGYFGDRPAFLALADLLEDTFDIDIRLVDRFGGPDPTSMPFGYFDMTGRCVANFSAVSMPLVIDGRPVRAVGYQSGAVRPEFRGKGLYRDLMRHAFAWAEAQDFELGILLTDKPALYEPYGFRSMPQHVFRGPAPTGTSRPTARVLNIEDGGDIAPIRRLLPARQPVSSLFAVTGHWIEFPLNACFDPTIRLSHIPGLDAIVAWRLGEGVFELLDIVACEVPPLAAVVGTLGIEQSVIAVHFPPDRLEWKSYRPEAYRSACDLMMMPMRPVKMPDKPFRLPPTAEF